MMESLLGGLSAFVWWLVRSTVQVSIVVCLVLAIKAVLRGRLPARWHYFLWLVVVARMIMPWAPASRFSVFNLMPERLSPKQADSTPAEEEKVSGTDAVPVGLNDWRPKPVDFNPEKIDEVATDVPAGNVTTAAPIEGYKQGDRGETGNKANTTRITSTKLFPWRLRNWEEIGSTGIKMLPVIWLAGAMVLVVYVSASNFGLWRIVKHERALTDQRILELLEDCKEQMGVRAVLGVVVSRQVRCPVLFGCIRPRLLLPRGIIETLTLEQLRYVFLHELAHLKRCDILLGWVMSMLSIVHWFNPLVWYAFYRMRVDREIACDGLALATMRVDEPQEYGRTIVNLLERFSRAQYVPGMVGILESKIRLERRITMIAEFTKGSRRITLPVVLLIVMMACVSLTNARRIGGIGSAGGSSIKQKQLVPRSARDSLVLYYSLDTDAERETAIDISGRGRHGQVHGASYATEGASGGAMSFDGSDDYISVPGIRLREYSFSAWVKTPLTGGSVNNRRIFMLGEGELYYTLEGNSRGGVSTYITADMELNEYDWAFERNRWTHITLTFDATTVRIYKDGRLTETRGGYFIFTKFVEGQAYIGGTRSQGGDFWHGMIDEVAVFNRALSETEVRQLYEMPGHPGEVSFEPPRPPVTPERPKYSPISGKKGRILYYSFDRDEGQTVTDQSGEGHRGSVHGARYEPGGRVGGAMSFDGSGNYISVPDVRLMEFSFSAWVKTPLTGGSANNRRIFTLGDGMHYYALQGNVGGALSIVADGEEINEYGWQFGTGTWTYLTLTHEAGTFKLYKDGILTETGHMVSSPVSGTLYIGGTSSQGGSFWQGMIDEVTVFNRALSETEVRQLYDRSGPPGAVQPRMPMVTGGAWGAARFAGTWSGQAVDKPEDGSSEDSLKLVLEIDEYGRLAGEAFGDFVKNGHCRLENLKAVGGGISFEVAHRIANLRMGVTLELRDGKLQGEGLPINFEEDRCDITLERVGDGGYMPVPRRKSAMWLGPQSLAGKWSGMAVDKPEDGSSRDGLSLDLRLSGEGHVVGEASGVFVRNGSCKLEHVKVFGNEISFEIPHRTAIRMAITLKFTDDGKLQGEGIPIDGDAQSDRCDITLERRGWSLSSGISGPETQVLGGLDRYAGTWSGMAIDKPEDGTSRDPLSVKLAVDEYGRLAGEASGRFVKDGHYRLENLRVTGNQLYFEVRHRFKNMRMGITLELRGGKLQGEGIPLDIEEDRCDITLERKSAGIGAYIPTGVKKKR